MFVVGSMLVFGTIGAFVKASGQSAFNIVFFRCLFAAVCLGGYVVTTSRIQPGFFKISVLWPLVASGAALAFNWVFLFKAFAATSITTGIIFYYTQPFILILMGFLFFKETIRAYHLFWTGMAFIGLILSTGVLNQGLDVANLAQGAMFGLAAAGLYAVVVVITKYLKQIPPAFIVFVQTAVGMICLLPFTQLSEIPLAGAHWYYLISLGVVHTAFAYLFFYKGVQHLGTVVITVLGFIDPVVAIFSDILLFGQRIGWIQGAGIVMILGGGAAVQLGVSRKYIKQHVFRRQR